MRILIELGKLLENIKISAKESSRLLRTEQHKPWFDEGYSNYYNKEISQIAVVTGSIPKKWR
jgi:hypothetical protein